MPGLVLDTTVLIDALRGRPAADRIRQLLKARMPLLTTAINVEEIVRGLRPKEAFAAEALFDGLLLLPIRREEAELAGVWRREYAQRGITLRQADCLIAAATAQAQASLATGSPKDFPMAGIGVEEWPVGQ
jgi:predicted nucleic acid-binding protein